MAARDAVTSAFNGLVPEASRAEPTTATDHVHQSVMDLVVAMSGLDRERVRSGRLSRSDWENLMQAANRLSQMPIAFVS